MMGLGSDEKRGKAVSKIPPHHPPHHQRRHHLKKPDWDLWYEATASLGFSQIGRPPKQIYQDKSSRCQCAVLYYMRGTVKNRTTYLVSVTIIDQFSLGKTFWWFAARGSKLDLFICHERISLCTSLDLSICPERISLVCVCGSYIETGQVFPQVAGNEPQAVRLNYNHHYCQLYRHHCLYSYDCSHQNQFKVLAMIIHIVNIAIITSNLLLSSPLLTLSSTTRRWHHHCVATHCRLISKLHSSKSCFRIDTFSLISVLSWRLFFLPTCSVGKPTTSFNILIRCTFGETTPCFTLEELLLGTFHQMSSRRIIQPWIQDLKVKYYLSQFPLWQLTHDHHHRHQQHCRRYVDQRCYHHCPNLRLKGAKLSVALLLIWIFKYRQLATSSFSSSDKYKYKYKYKCVFKYRHLATSSFSSSSSQTINITINWQIIVVKRGN